jgi:hypothetical protein
MYKRASSIGPVIVFSLMFVPLIWGSSAFAAGGHFRYSHGEPLNDLHATPGAIFKVSVATVCRSGYATSVRNVSQSEKNDVYAEYGITHHKMNEYEIDHLISLELGGNNSVANLWPELNDHLHGYLNSKDKLENRLHTLVCSGALALHSAQTQISTNWVATYHKYLGAWPHGGTSTTLPTSTIRPVTTTTSGSSGVKITSVIASVSPGREETLTAHSSRPHDTCNLVVILPSGRQSTSGGLGTTSANATGLATWIWQIGTRTGAGTAQVTVSCNAGVAYGTFVIT